VSAVFMTLTILVMLRSFYKRIRDSRKNAAV
jgi:hypothetical protein